MPIIKKPGNDESRLNLINTAINVGTADASAGNYYLSTTTIENATRLKNNYETALYAFVGTLSERSKEVRQKNSAIETLNTYIRDALVLLKRRVNRNNEPAEVLTYYGLPLSGTLPGGLNESELLAIAETIIEGDSKAVTAGYSPISCPSAIELAEVLASTRKQIFEVAPADRSYYNAQKAVAEIRSEVNILINDIIAELKFNLRKHEPANRRRIMRTYGVTFKSAVVSNNQIEESS